MAFEVNMKYVSLVLLVFFTSAQVLCMRYAKTLPGDPYDSSTAVLLGEIMKLVMSFLLLSMEKKSVRSAASQLANEVSNHSRDVLLQSVPAILYTIQNNFLYIAITNLEAAVFQVSSQLKLLTAAIFSVTFLKKYISGMQWFSLVILGAGVVLVQFDPNAKSTTSGNLTLGLIAVVIACTTSGFAGVFMEKMFKDKKLTVWNRNFWLAIWSMLVGMATLLFKDYHFIFPSVFFKNYNIYAWIAVFLLAVGGLVIGLVLKYADNILKAFAGSASILISTVLSVFIFHTHLTSNFVIGGTLVMIAVVLYSYGGRKVEYKPVPTQEKTNV